jgi:hypothetical protein
MAGVLRPGTVNNVWKQRKADGQATLTLSRRQSYNAADRFPTAGSLRRLTSLPI